MGSMEKLSSNLENRIVRYDEAVDPEQLTAHPLNFRRHPAAQRKALRASIEGHGWVTAVLATADGTVIDGHARVEEALSAGVTVPVLYTDLDEHEAGAMIMRLDPIAAMATVDTDVLDDLLSIHADTWTDNEDALKDTLATLIENDAHPNIDDILGGMGLVPDGEDSEFTSMTFLFSQEQAGIVREAIRMAIDAGRAVDDVNANQNGNAIAAIAVEWAGRSGG